MLGDSYVLITGRTDKGVCGKPSAELRRQGWEMIYVIGNFVTKYTGRPHQSRTLALPYLETLAPWMFLWEAWGEKRKSKIKG